MLVSTGAASLIAGRLPLLSISLSVCLGLVQAAVVDQLPSMVSLVWALKRKEYQHLAVYSTALQWLYCLLLYCHCFYGKLEYGFWLRLILFLPCLTLM